MPGDTIISMPCAPRKCLSLLNSSEFREEEAVSLACSARAITQSALASRQPTAGVDIVPFAANAAFEMISTSSGNVECSAAAA